MNQYQQRKWMKWVALFLLGVFAQAMFVLPISERAIAQTSAQNSAQTLAQALTQGSAQAPSQSCSAPSSALTPEELNYARSAWTYFVDNLQPATGFVNAAGGYPSGTLWDSGNYLTALNAARWLGFIDQSEFDYKLNLFLTGLSRINLFEGALPNKVYNTATGEMVNYVNEAVERGIGWSALDLGRVLAAFHIIRTCHPQYSNWLQGIVDRWHVESAVKGGLLYGAMVLPSDETLLVQEGRFGYEEYAARGFELWGFDVSEARELEPFNFVDVYGIQVPVDTRDYARTNANNYVVSESYILEAIEFGLKDELADFANRVFEVQKRRYENTGLLTAVSEDNINKAPHFLYNTVYANGTPWAVITDGNINHPELRTLSTKAAFGWRYIYPESEYGKLLFDKVKDLTNSGRGYYAGIYEVGLNAPQPLLNDILTSNTNGLILETLYFKARGSLALITGLPAPTLTATASTASTSSANTSSTPPANTSATATSSTATSSASSSAASSSAAPSSAASSTSPSLGTSPAAPTPIAVAAIPPVGEPRRSACPRLAQPLSIPDQRYAKTAWQYFEANLHSTGLVDDRGDLPGATLWGLGDYLTALHAAQALGVVSPQSFDQKVRQLLGALKVLPLFAGELPNRGYDPITLQPIDYGGNVKAEGTGWSGLDIGRMLAALHMLKTCHPEYTDAIDQVPLDWSYLRVVRDGQLTNAMLTPNSQGRSQIQVNPSTLLGYEEYAARAFQLWGFDVARSAIGGGYQTETVEGYAVPVRRQQPAPEQLNELNTVSTPFILYGLEFGFDPQMRSLIEAIFQAEATRYDRTGSFSASGTSLINQSPYILHSTIVGNGEPWAVVSDAGELIEHDRVVSTAVAFAYYTLFPDTPYSQKLWQATLDLYSTAQGYYEGFYEKSGNTAIGFTADTNSLILQALLHKATVHQPLIQPHASLNSPWWEQVQRGNSGQGLPEAAMPPIQMVTRSSDSYWVEAAPETAPENTPETTPTASRTRG